MKVFSQLSALTSPLLRILNSQHSPEYPPDLAFLEHFGHYAASTYQRFEDWQTCSACRPADICQTTLNTTWSTTFPAFSRGYVGINKPSKEIIVAFRGSTHIMDAISDIQLFQSPWPLDTAGSLVHSGFLQAYLAARPHVFKALDTLMGDPEYVEYAIYFTGHSLGGAQATIAYLDYMKYKYKHKPLIRAQRPRLITFGAPRVGNRQFVQQIDGLWNDEMDVEWPTVRVVHELDLVPHLPKSIYPGQYAHSDREIWARDADDGSMDLVLCEPSANKDSRGGYRYQEDSNCSAGTNPLLWNVPDHMVYPGMRLGIPKYNVNKQS